MVSETEQLLETQDSSQEEKKRSSEEEEFEPASYEELCGDFMEED